MLASQFVTGLEMDVEAVSTMAAAEAVLADDAEAFFVAVVNVNLKDSNEGEIVDALNRNSIPVIAFSLHEDRELREKVISRFVLDFVQIKTRQHFEHIEKLVERIHRSYKTTILLVEPSMAFRFYISDLLRKHCFTVIEAESIDDVMLTLRENSQIKLVVADGNANGIELIESIRSHFTPQSLGIVAMSASDDPEVNVDLLKAGASDFIRKPFAMEEFFCRINQNVEILGYIEEIRNSMIRDYLTGAYNRRYLYEAGEQFYMNARRGHISMAVAMIDADHFKQINDTYGHDVGDEVLIRIASTLKKTLRASDIVARFGGEEFVCIVNCITLESVGELFERVREAIENLRIRTKQGELTVTVSVGVTYKLGRSLDEMLNAADEAMYAAKTGGRNRVVVNRP